MPVADDISILAPRGHDIIIWKIDQNLEWIDSIGICLNMF